MYISEQKFMFFRAALFILFKDDFLIFVFLRFLSRTFNGVPGILVNLDETVPKLLIEFVRKIYNQMYININYYSNVRAVFPHYY